MSLLLYSIGRSTVRRGGDVSGVSLLSGVAWAAEVRVS